MLSGRREKQHRSQDQDRADKISQRQAIAGFLRAQRELDSKLVRESNAIDMHPDPRALLFDQDKLVAFIGVKVTYFNGLLGELEALDLNLHDRFVRKKFLKLNKYIRSRKEAFDHELSNLSLHDTDAHLRTIEKHLTEGIVTEEMQEIREGLIETARTRLRLAPAGGDEYPGMFTPVE